MCSPFRAAQDILILATIRDDLAKAQQAKNEAERVARATAADVEDLKSRVEDAARAKAKFAKENRYNPPASSVPALTLG